MGHQNLNNQTTTAPNIYLFGDKSSKKANPTIIATVGFVVVIFVALLGVRHLYLVSNSSYHNMNQVPTASPPLHADTRNRYLGVRNQIQAKSSGLAQAQTSLFERYPNSSNKGDMVIDEDFIWIANGAGLIKYNKKSGEQKIFTETDGLLGNETTGLIKYKDEVWVASQSRGISILDTTNNSWRYFTTANGLISDGNLEIKLDGDVIWLATFEGFARYDLKTGNWTNWKEGADITFAGVHDFVFNDNFVWIYVSPNAYTAGGVVKLDKKMLTWTYLQINNQVLTRRQLDSINLYLDGDFLYVISDNIYRQNMITEQWDSFPSIDSNLRKFHIGAFKHDSQYWTFNNVGNIDISGDVNSRQRTINTKQLNQNCPRINHSFNFGGMEDGYIKQFTFDGDILWFGCRQGFAFYNLGNKTWNFRETKSNYPAEIYEIFAVRDGTLLVDSNLGLGLIQPDQQEWTFIKSLQAESAIWSGDDIYFIEELPEAGGEGAFPTLRPNLWKYNILSKSIGRIKSKPTDALSLRETSGGISKLIDLKINNNLWFNVGNKIQEFNIASGQVFSYEPKIAQGKYLSIKDIKKEDNVLWFVSNLQHMSSDFQSESSNLTVAAGLGSLNLLSKEFKFENNPVGIQLPGWGLEHLSIVGNRIWADAIDNPGNGLYIYDLTAKTWEHVTRTNSGLKFDSVKMLTGTPHYLLMASFGVVDFSQRKRGDVSVYTVANTYVYEQYGLNIYDIANNTWKFYTSEDGMLDGEIRDEHIDGNNVWFVNAEDGIWKLNLDKLK